MQLGELIHRYRKEHDISMEELAARSGLSKGYISMLEKNRNPSTGKAIEPSSQTIRRLAEATGIPINKLMRAANPYLTLDIDDMFAEPDTIAYENIPLLHNKLTLDKPYLDKENIDHYEQAPIGLPGGFVLNCRDNSMTEAGIHALDKVYFVEQAQVENGEIAAVVVNREIIIRRVFTQNGSVVLQAENKDYPPMIYTATEQDKFKIIGKCLYCLSRIQ